MRELSRGSMIICNICNGKWVNHNYSKNRPIVSHLATKYAPKNTNMKCQTSWRTDTVRIWNTYSSPLEGGGEEVSPTWSQRIKHGWSNPALFRFAIHTRSVTAELVWGSKILQKPLLRCRLERYWLTTRAVEGIWIPVYFRDIGRLVLCNTKLILSTTTD
jgi:hypothetical protein